MEMEDKEYPVFEEDVHVDKCCESPAGYAATGSGFSNTIAEPETVIMSDSYDPFIGPYTMDELNARIDEAETYIEKAERGDWSDWVTEKQSRANLYSKYPWLR